MFDEAKQYLIKNDNNEILRDIIYEELYKFLSNYLYNVDFI